MYINENSGTNIVSLREVKENFKSYRAIDKRFKEFIWFFTDEEILGCFNLNL